MIEKYDGVLAASDHTRESIVREIEEIVEEYNKTMKGRSNYCTVFPHPRNMSFILAVHTDNSDVTSELAFHQITREIER